MNKAEVIDMINVACPHCRGGNPPRFRGDSSEWVHDFVKGSQISHTFCLADGIRKKYAAVLNAE